jgi:hypothetical protein
MPSPSTLTAVIVAVLVMALILDLVRRRRLREEYSVLWLITGCAMVLIAIWYDPLVYLTNLIGLTNPNVTLFFFGLIFLVTLNIYYSVKISALTEQVKTLAQRLALHEEEQVKDHLPEDSLRESGGGQDTRLEPRR